MIVFSKQDKKRVSSEEMIDRMKLNHMLRARKWAHVEISFNDFGSFAMLQKTMISLISDAPAPPKSRMEEEEEELYRTRSGDLVRKNLDGQSVDVQTLQVVANESLTRVEFQKGEPTRAERQAEGMGKKKTEKTPPPFWSLRKNKLLCLLGG